MEQKQIFKTKKFQIFKNLELLMNILLNVQVSDACHQAGSKR